MREIENTTPFDSILVGEARQFATAGSLIDSLWVFRMSPEDMDFGAVGDLVVNAELIVDLSTIGANIGEPGNAAAIDRVLRRLYGADVTLGTNTQDAATAVIVVVHSLDHTPASVNELTRTLEEATPLLAVRGDAATGTLQQNLRTALR